jgi:hypothetical protein
MERMWGVILCWSVLEDKLELPLFGAARSRSPEFVLLIWRETFGPSPSLKGNDALLRKESCKRTT